MLCAADMTCDWTERKSNGPLRSAAYLFMVSSMSLAVIVAASLHVAHATRTTTSVFASGESPIPFVKEISTSSLFTVLLDTIFHPSNVSALRT